MNTLLFVYNADSGALNFLMDAAHKIFSPATYPCNLCAVTYTVSGLPRWRRFVKSLPWPVEFLHRDELAEQYGRRDADLPAAFMWDGNQLDVWIDAEEMNSFKTLEELIKSVQQRTEGMQV